MKHFYNLIISYFLFQIIIVFIKSAVCQTENIIYKGKPAKDGQFPGIVGLSLYSPREPPFCGGTLINENTILTAAHCLSKFVTSKTEPEDIIVNACSNDYYNDTYLFSQSYESQHQYRYAEFLCPHPKYNEAKMDMRHDIALLYVNEPFNITNTCYPMQLATKATDYNEFCEVVGWGLDEHLNIPNELRFVKIPITKGEECKKIFNNFDGKFTICAGIPDKGDSCIGDSGGPLICKGRLEGLVSFGRTICGDYAGYTKVLAHLDFINGPETKSECVLNSLNPYLLNENKNGCNKYDSKTHFFIFILLFCVLKLYLIYSINFV